MLQSFLNKEGHPKRSVKYLFCSDFAQTFSFVFITDHKDSNEGNWGILLLY